MQTQVPLPQLARVLVRYTCAAFTPTSTGSGNYAIPANYCVAGRVIHITASGVTTTNANTTGYGPWGIYIGASGNSSYANEVNDTLIGGTTPSVSLTASQSNMPWQIQFDMICNSTTSITGEGTFTFSTTSSTGAETTVPIRASGSTAATTSLVSSNSTATPTTQLNYIYLFPQLTGSGSVTGASTTLEQLIISGT